MGLVDCDKKTGDLGCQGGLPSNAFKDMIENKIGLELESQYPYTAHDGRCKAAQAQEKVFISNWTSISTDEDQIAAALMKYGPLSIGINAGPMQFYMGGIAKPWKISATLRNLTMAWQSSASVNRLVPSTGSSGTAGAQLGARKDTTASSVEQAPAA